MQAMILAAGMGKRLKHLTENNTKCMVKVNGVSMIERALKILDKKHFSRIVIVVGYEGQKLIDFIAELEIDTSIEYVWNTDYEKTNNIYSLSLAKKYLCQEDTILLESDLVFEEKVIDMLFEDERQSLALVDKFESWMDGSCMVIDADDRILDFIPGKYFDFAEKEKYYKTVNIYKLSAGFSENVYVPFLEAYEKAMGENEYYESVIKLIAMLDTNEIRVKRLTGQKWYEIDDMQDLDIAESMFETDVRARYRKLMCRYGGFWRYPHLIDYCYLVNPYFPPQRMKMELISSFEKLLTQYPSGQEVDSIIAANVFGVKNEYIVLGNGAAELIKALLDILHGKMGIIMPTFQEYANRYSGEKVIYYPENKDFHYGAEELMEFFEDKEISILVLINPDNPSGNYIPVKEMIKIIKWSEKKNIKVIVDESFVDFVETEEISESENVTLIEDNILEKYPDLYVIKSISKSYGVPGIRLGILASADMNLLNKVRKELPIWNINSYGEFFMQIINKYKKTYAEALTEFRKARSQMIEHLTQISFLRIIPTQANYVMCEVVKGTSEELCVQMFEKGFLIKDLTAKVADGKQYIRLAIRKFEENEKLIRNLETYTEGELE